MAYETGVASSPFDLRDKLATFAVANGWTNTNSLDGHKVLSKGQVVVAVAADASNIYGRGATSPSGAANWNVQPGTGTWQHVSNLGAGPFTAYHFYALAEEGKDFLGAVIEIQSGVFRHFIICDLIKYGAWTGGPYTNSTYWNTGSNNINQPGSTYHRFICDAYQQNSPAGGHFWCEADGQVIPAAWCLEWHYGDYTASVRGIGSWRQSITNWLLDAGWQRWNLRTPLFPAEIYLNRPAGLRSIIGRIPSFRLCNIRNHTPGEIVNIGGSDFQLWPICARTDTWGSGNSTIYSSAHAGYAYKRT